MSIWASWERIGWEPECEVLDDDGVHVEPGRFERGVVRAYRDGFSNAYPDGTDAGATVDVASIPAWCVPGCEDADGDDRCDDMGPWLRLWVDSPGARSWSGADPRFRPICRPLWAAVVLDEAAVGALRDDLSAWLARGKVHPTVDSRSPVGGGSHETHGGRPIHTRKE